MPNYEFRCDNCNHSYDEFHSLEEWGKFKIKGLKCKKCGKRKVNKAITVVGFEIKGWSCAKELKRYQQADLAEQCIEEAKTKGVTKMEQEEGMGLMADREKKLGKEPGSISGKRQVKYEEKDGKRSLPKERKAVMAKQAKLQSEKRKK